TAPATIVAAAKRYASRRPVAWMMAAPTSGPMKLDTRHTPASVVSARARNRVGTIATICACRDTWNAAWPAPARNAPTAKAGTTVANAHTSAATAVAASAHADARAAP